MYLAAIFFFHEKMNSRIARKINWNARQCQYGFHVNFNSSSTFKDIFFDMFDCGKHNQPFVYRWDQKEEYGKYVILQHVWGFSDSINHPIPADLVLNPSEENDFNSLTYMIHEQDSPLSQFYRQMIRVKMHADRSLPPKIITVVGEERNETIIEWPEKKPTQKSSMKQYKDFIDKYNRPIDCKSLPSEFEMTLLELLNNWDVGLEVHRHEDDFKLLDVHHLPCKFIQRHIEYYDDKDEIEPYYPITLPKVIFQRSDELRMSYFSNWQKFKSKFLRFYHSKDIPILSKWEDMNEGVYYIVHHSRIGRNYKYPAVDFVVDSYGKMVYALPSLARAYQRKVLVQVGQDTKIPPKIVKIEPEDDRKVKKLKTIDENITNHDIYDEECEANTVDWVNPGRVEITLLQLLCTWDTALEVYYRNGSFEVRAIHALPCEILKKTIRKYDFKCEISACSEYCQLVVEKNINEN